MIRVSDPDLVLRQGDVLAELAELADESVDCVVTSPPYWGLRDYGTGTWEGGDESCDHLGRAHKQAGFNERWFGSEATETWNDKQGELRRPFREVCGKCGARRVDDQLGLEATPELYLERMVGVFREVRRVLSKTGTAWVNMGDSYNAYNRNRGPSESISAAADVARNEPGAGLSAPNLKPKDLVGMPWMLALAMQADGWTLRADVVWHKPNPMPESVSDRPTKAHEYVFLFAKSRRYYWDKEASREPFSPDTHSRGGGRQRAAARGDDRYVGADFKTYGDDGKTGRFQGASGGDVLEGLDLEPLSDDPNWCRPDGWASGPGSHSAVEHSRRENKQETLSPELPPEPERGPDGRRVTTRTVGADSHENYQEFGHEEGRERWPNPDGRNMRDVWTIPLQGYAEAHFATYPEELVRRCLTASCPSGGTVLDPFAGSGTTAVVARRMGRRSVLIELNPDYCDMIVERTMQLSLLAEEGEA